MQINYNDLVWKAENPYQYWLSEHESQKFEESVVYTEFVIYCGSNGKVHQNAMSEFQAFFDNNPDVDIVYADEDYLDEFGNRCNPWFKPEYSPDTLESFCYFGNIYALRKKLLDSVTTQKGYFSSGEDLNHEMILKASKMGTKIGHISKVLFTNDYSKESVDAGINDQVIDYDIIDDKEEDKYLGIDECERRLKLDFTGETVSVIIPSKNNCKLLSKCITSFIQRTDYPQYEFVVVDNGSSDEQKLCITELFAQLLGRYVGLRLQYIYEPMEFNFSRMCNIGAAKASGKYLLFLNDDIEIVTDDWLTRMVAQASKEHVGAVGAKLLYPRSEEDGVMGKPYRIQHVGITNMGIGPAHKLSGMDDIGSLYHGHNVYNYDVIAVTAACLLIRRDVFNRLEGFDESLAVAYNDVELCFRVYKAGYFNVQCNQAVLLHHESVTRGQDDSKEKKERLAKEKASLYEKHPDLYAKDPFYSENLVQWRKDVDYSVNAVYPHERPVTIKVFEGHLPKRHGNKYVRKMTGEDRMMLSIDSIEHELYEKQLVIKGWFVIRGVDNSKLDKKIIIKNTDTGVIYYADILPVYRPDVRNMFMNSNTGTTKIALSGINVVVDLNQTEPDIKSLATQRLQIGVLADKKIIWEETLWNQTK